MTLEQLDYLGSLVQIEHSKLNIFDQENYSKAQAFILGVANELQTMATALTPKPDEPKLEIVE